MFPGKTIDLITDILNNAVMAVEWIFFAYESGHQNNRDSIKHGISTFNKHQHTYRALTWEELEVSGKIVNATILKAIDDCSVFVADLTYQNHNVLFEFGYAVGKRKKLLLLLNEQVDGASQRHKDSRIMQNIGYQPFSSGNDILRALQQHKFEDEVSVTSLIDSRVSQIDTMDMVYLESRSQTQASLDVKSSLSEIGDQIIIKDSAEVEYQTLTWYVASIVQSKLVIIHLVDIDTLGHESYNGEYSFFAGMAKGLGKPVALLAPSPFKAPIDYSDILIVYESSADCVEKVLKWYNQTRQDVIKAAVRRVDITEGPSELDTVRRGIGYESAEEESRELLKYFIEVETLQHATQRGSSIIIGRKGAGKSALFLKLRAEFESEGGNVFTVTLQPESDELIGNVNLSKLYESAASKQSFLTAVWRFVILSRLLDNVVRKILAQHVDDQPTELKILKFAQDNENLIRTGHFAFISNIYSELDTIKGFGNQHALERLYTKYISPIRDLLREYFSGRRFVEINIFADNLDKTWEAENDLDLQANMILQLLAFNDRISNELKIVDSKQHIIIFLRNDIFEYILDRAREPDKLVAKKSEINWYQFPERLQELLEARFRHSLGRSSDETVDDIWRQYFQLGGRQHPFELIARVVVPRPRDHIFFTRRLFESSINRKSQRITKDDFEYAVEQYSHYLYQNMIAETRARFPQIVAVLTEVNRLTHSGMLEDRRFDRLLSRNGISGENRDEFLKFLFEKDFIYCFERNTEKVVENADEFFELSKKKRVGMFRKHRMMVQVIPNRARLKNTSSRLP